MFKKLHRRLTLICITVTGIILIGMSVTCLYIAEQGLKNNIYGTFLNNLNSLLTYMDSQSVISQKWMSTMEFNNNFIIYVEDGGIPLLYSSLEDRDLRMTLAAQAKEISDREYDFDIDTYNLSGNIPMHVEFSMETEDGSGYYVSTALLPRENSQIKLIVFYSLDNLDAQITAQRLMFTGINIAAVFCLGLFSWLFTGRTLKPIEENRKKQTEFIASASHELRTPLAVILSSLSAMTKADEKEREKFSGVITSEGNRMSRLISDMLTLANADNKSWTVIPARAEADTLLLDCYEMYQPIAKKKNITMEIKLPDETVPRCQMDVQRIEQVLSILVDNAISYTQEGGRIILSLIHKGSRLIIRVADNGPGIPDEDKKKIFDRFYRADSSHSKKDHFGLGLCIAAEIMQLHHGSIKVSDTPGGGATFSLELKL